MDSVWVVQYRVPLPVNSNELWAIARYREVRIAFKTERGAEEFFNNEVKNQKWYDSATCKVEEVPLV